MSMSLDEAVELLDEYGSSQDPITYKGEYTTPVELSMTLEGTLFNARDIRIDYLGGTDGKPKEVRNGTLSGMVTNRRKLSRNAAFPMSPLPKTCKTCGQRIKS